MLSCVRRSGLLVALMITHLSIWPACALGQQTTAQATWDTRSLSRIVKPMRNSLNGRLPLVAWFLPDITFGNQAVIDRANGVLSGQIGTLWSRGVVPVIPLQQASGITAAGMIAVGLTVQEQGAPVHSIVVLPNGGDRSYWPDDSMWFTFSGRAWPVLPAAVATPAYDYVRAHLENLRTGGVTVNALWQDWESWANSPYNNNYQAQNWYVQNVDAGTYNRLGLDPEIPSNFNKLEQWIYQHKQELLDASSRQALTDTFSADAPFGNYANVRSVSPAVTLSAGTAAMPSLYANNTALPAQFGATEPVTQSKVDDIQWFWMLRTFSLTASNDSAEDITVPFVSPWVNDLNDAKYNGWGMSRPVYREFLKHVWLRGADGMYVFNYNPLIYTTYTAQSELEKIEDARAVLDEMLNYRVFLEHGTPMTFAFDSAMNYSARTVWSGLACANDALVQVTSRNGSTQPVTLTAFGRQFNLAPVANAGATYYLKSDGQAHRVDSRAESAHLQLENELVDSSPERLTVTFGKAAADVPDIEFSTLVPNERIRSGVYGFLSDEHDSHSVRLARVPDSGDGNWVSIQNAAGAFDSRSFTAEVFVNLESGNADRANLLSKAISSSSVDWQLTWRQDNRLELALTLQTGRVWLRTAPDARLAEAHGWHHIAVAYDGNLDQVTVYLDYKPLPWQDAGGDNGAAPSLGGMVPSDIVYQIAADFRIGYLNQGVNGLFDEFRFTPERLDPYQFMRIASATTP